MGITFPLLGDEEREAHQAMEVNSANLFSLLRRDNFEARVRAAGGHSQYNLGKNPFRLGGVLFLGQGDVGSRGAFSRNIWKTIACRKH